MSKREVVRLPVLPPQREKISYSEWMMFRTNCEWRWYLDYVLGIRRNDESVALSFGTVVHETLEFLLLSDRSTRPSIDEAVAHFRLGLEKALMNLYSIKALPFGPWPEDHPHTPWALELSGERIIRAIPTVPDLWEAEVVALEFELDDELSRADGDVRFRGFVDFLATVKDRNGRLVFIVGDFKTCKWGWPRPKKEDPDVLAQPRLYKHFICKRFGVDPKRVRTFFFLMKKEPGRKDPMTVEPLRIPSSERDISQTIDAMQADITRMRGGVYERRRFDDAGRPNCMKPWGMCPHYDTEACPSSPEVDQALAGASS